MWLGRRVGKEREIRREREIDFNGFSESISKLACVHVYARMLARLHAYMPAGMHIHMHWYTNSTRAYAPRRPGTISTGVEHGEEIIAGIP